MKWITAKEDYQGSDPATGEEFRLLEGQAREVSDEKSEQLERDFPDSFDFSDKKPKNAVAIEGNPPPPGDAPNSEGETETPSAEDRATELGKLKRDELDEIAGTLNIADPSAFKNKDEVVAAIVQVEARRTALADLDRDQLNELAAEWSIEDPADIEPDALLDQIILAETAKLHE